MLDYFSKDKFIKKIRDLRIGGLPSKEIAAQIGVHFTTIDRWLRGEVNLDTITVKAYRDVVGDPGEIGARLSVVHEECPPYGLQPQTAEALAPYVRMLAFIHGASEAQWEIIKGNIETFYRELGGGKRGARQKTGE